MAKAKGPTKAQLAAVAKDKELRNPITGEAPNSFTKTDRELPAPVNVQQYAGDPATRRRLRAAHVEASKPNVETDKPLGMSDEHYAWLMGAHHMFSNVAAERGTPAINEPHESHPGITVQRRAEDLSGKEYRKGEAILTHYGHDGRNPTRSLRETQSRNLQRVIHEHVMSGVDESASQKFYGGAVNTELPDPEMDAAHAEGVHAAHQRFMQTVRSTAMHPKFQEATAGLSHRERMSAATNLAAQATADTSPNARWRSNGRWPNLEQAEESIHAGLEDRTPKFVEGRKANHAKATRRTEEAVASGDYSVHQYGNPRDAPKTIAFRGALVDRDHTDAYKVTDVHEAGALAPGLHPAKAHMYEHPGTEDVPETQRGKKVSIYPDQPKSDAKGLVALTEYSISQGASKPVWGKSRAEQMLKDGSGIIHALNDHATRQVLANHGLSRGVNFSDNVHAAQGAVWGSTQSRRADLSVSHADQYPVVRDWGSEGHAELNEAGKDFFGHDFAPHNMGAQFVRNPNTLGQVGSRGSGEKKKDPLQGKPYPVMGTEK